MNVKNWGHKRDAALNWDLDKMMSCKLMHSLRSMTMAIMQIKDDYLLGGSSLCIRVDWRTLQVKQWTGGKSINGILPLGAPPTGFCLLVLTSRVDFFPDFFLTFSHFLQQLPHVYYVQGIANYEE